MPGPGANAINRIKRSRKRGFYDLPTLYSILDSAFVCQVGFIDAGVPIIIPMVFGRAGSKIFLHGASRGRLATLLGKGGQICVHVTHIDGVIFSRSAFDHSVNYRSTVFFGRPRLVPEAKKLRALKIISDHIAPGRWREVRQPSPAELKSTSVIEVRIQQASSKIRTGPPKDQRKDLRLPVWAGEVPLRLVALDPVRDASGEGMADASPSVRRFVTRNSLR